MSRHGYAQRITVRRSSIHGRGAFAAESLPSGAVLDRGMIVWRGPRDTGEFVDTYSFDAGQHGCIALGVVSLCNHSDTPNAEIEVCEEDMTYRLLAKRPIARGEEICVDYGEAYWS